MTDRGFSSLLALTAFLTLACNDPEAPGAAAAVMLGEWRYGRPADAGELPSLNAGVFVTIAIDSASGNRFVGRVTGWFVGDFGLSLDRFGPVTGTIENRHDVTLRIAPPAAEMAAHTIRGEVDADVLIVLESWVGANVGPFPNGGRFVRLH